MFLLFYLNLRVTVGEYPSLKGTDLVDQSASLLVEVVDQRAVVGLGRDAWLWVRYATDKIAVGQKDRREERLERILKLRIRVQACGHTFGKERAANVVDALL